jgi:flagellar biosynthesis protein FliR
MAIPVFSAEQIETFLLVLLRVSALIIAMPVMSERSVPGKVKAGLSLLIAFLIYPFVPPVESSSADLPALFLKMAGEIFIGVLLGFASQLIFAGIQLGGQFIGFEMGFSIVNIVDPVTSRQISIIAEFQYLVAILVFLTLNAHHVFIMAISESYRILPPMGFHFSGELLQLLVELSRNMFVIALKISAPIIAALLFTNVGLGLIARTVPQINVFIIGFPLQIAIGLFGIGMTMPIFLHIIETLFLNMEGEFSTMLRLMGAP